MDLPISLASRRLRSISGRSRRSALSCSIRSKANKTASSPRCLLRSARKSGVVACDDRFAVDQERRRFDAEGSGNDGREAVGPIVAVAGEAADAGAIPAHHEAITIVLDLMDPQRPGWWPGRLRRQASCNEAGDHDWTAGITGRTYPLLGWIASRTPTAERV
jgi:hypothetical protein